MAGEKNADEVIDSGGRSNTAGTTKIAFTKIKCDAFVARYNSDHNMITVYDRDGKNLSAEMLENSPIRSSSDPSKPKIRNFTPEEAVDQMNYLKNKAEELCGGSHRSGRGSASEILGDIDDFPTFEVKILSTSNGVVPEGAAQASPTAQKCGVGESAVSYDR